MGAFGCGLVPDAELQAARRNNQHGSRMSRPIPAPVQAMKSRLPTDTDPRNRPTSAALGAGLRVPSQAGVRALRTSLGESQRLDGVDGFSHDTGRSIVRPAVHPIDFAHFQRQTGGLAFDGQDVDRAGLSGWAAAP